MKVEWLAVMLTYWEGTEGAGSLHSSDTTTALIDVDGMKIVSIDDSGTHERTENLSKNVTGNLFPRELSPNGERKSDLGEIFEPSLNHPCPGDIQQG
jgi:hypothetical protein